MQFAFVRAQFIKGDFIVVDVAQQPFVGVKAVIFLPQNVHGPVDIIGVLNGLANARGFALALGIETRLGDGGFGDEQARVIHVIIHAALHGSGKGTHENAMSLGRLDVQPDIGEIGSSQPRHGDVSENDLAVRGCRSRGREGAAMLGARLGHGAGLTIGKSQPFQSRRHGC